MSSVTTTRPLESAGFSLIEVLVAMLVLAIGLLGLAALQTQGVRFNHDAMVRSQSTALAYDIIEKMRANAQKNAGLGAIDYTTANFPARNAQPAEGYSTDSPPYNCEANVMIGNANATNDLTCWLNAVELTLPLGRARIDQQPAPNDRYFNITLLWLDREPREFGGTTRLAQNAGECEALNNRQWRAAEGRCFVTQVWTVFP